MQELGIGRESDGLGLHGGIHRHALEIAGAQRASRMRHAQALGQEKVELVAEPLAPMAQVRPFMRKRVLEELLAGEILEVGVVDPALTHAFVG